MNLIKFFLFYNVELLIYFFWEILFCLINITNNSKFFLFLWKLRAKKTKEKNVKSFMIFCRSKCSTFFANQIFFFSVDLKAAQITCVQFFIQEMMTSKGESC